MDRLHAKEYNMGHHGNSFLSFGGPAAVGGWKELARTTLGSAGDIISVGSLPDKRYYMVLSDNLDTVSAIRTKFRLNSDSGTNYASRWELNGGTDDTDVSSTDLVNMASGFSNPNFLVSYYANLSTKEKLMISDCVIQNTAGAANAPARQNTVGKHAQTSNPISTISSINDGAGSFDVGSELVVLGWDPADEHTDNFWEQLASVNAGGSSTNLSSGTFTAKKYLWIQAFVKNTTVHTIDMTFNNDTGTSYALRKATNGGTDITDVSQTDIELFTATNSPYFVNMFIINNSANEKLVIGQAANRSGAGAAADPNRREFVAKWTNTASQITEIDIDSSAGNWDSKSIIKVWGSN